MFLPRVPLFCKGTPTPSKRQMRGTYPPQQYLPLPYINTETYVGVLIELAFKGQNRGRLHKNHGVRRYNREVINQNTIQGPDGNRTTLKGKHAPGDVFGGSGFPNFY